MSSAAPDLSPAGRRSALALARAIIPGTERIPAADEALVLRAEELVRRFSPSYVRAWRLLQGLLGAAGLARTGRPLHSLSSDRLDALVRSWENSSLLRGPLTLVGLLYKLAHFDAPRVYAAMGGCREVPQNLEQPRWLQQIHRAEDWPQGEADLECDAVVVGTGAGGAVVGRELAARGHAVLFVEEGEHYRRDAFDGSMVGAYQRFYRAALAVGNAAMPVFIGRMVGGSTAVNGATCFRTPSWILDAWCESLATDEFAPDRMARHFEAVEQFTSVAPAAQPEVGPIAGVVARGCDALGWSHLAVRRNVVGCTGKGFCDFGCRTDARRSTNLSYLPAALQAGAVLFTGLKAERVLVEGGRAVGVQAATKSGRVLRVRARVVVLAGGAVPTPALLLKQGLCNRSGEVGRNLTLHPSTGLSALFDEELRPAEHIPQGYGCDQFLRQGELILTAQPDVNIAAQVVNLAGRRLMETLEVASRIACFGILIRDATANGRLWLDVGGRPVLRYSVTAEDCARLHSGMVHTMDMLLAAGAKRIYPANLAHPLLELADVERFRRLTPAASDIGLLSYHPLGTCRMGKDPRHSVVGLDHQTHDVRGLFVVDGSTVPSAPGVNPQLTIMAMATRAAERIDDVLG